MRRDVGGARCSTLARRTLEHRSIELVGRQVVCIHLRVVGMVLRHLFISRQLRLLVGLCINMGVDMCID